MVHAWGFVKPDGWSRVSGMAISLPGEEPFDVFERVKANVERCGGEVEPGSVTRTLDGWFVGCTFETPERDGAARMWHVIERASDPWPAARPEPTATSEEQP